MKLILDKFKKYYATYDARTKTLSLQGKIPMKEWVELRLLIKMYNIELNDIRLNW
mgnify:CR=1 FL=1